MTLANLIRKREPATPANANPAKAANDGREGREPLARLATLALANPTEEKPAKPAKVGAGDAASASRWWLIHYPDRDSVEVACYPDATYAEILERHPDAVATEPFTPTIRQASPPLTASEETAIRAWLALIEETDPATIAEVIGQCQRDADVRDYFTGRTISENQDDLAVDRNRLETDHRRPCSQCLNLRGRVCSIAKPERGALVVANQGYQPAPDTLQRCAGYLPNASDTDQRLGRERWPEL